MAASRPTTTHTRRPQDSISAAADSRSTDSRLRPVRARLLRRAMPRRFPRPSTRDSRRRRGPRTAPLARRVGIGTEISRLIEQQRHSGGEPRGLADSGQPERSTTISSRTIKHPVAVRTGPRAGPRRLLFTDTHACSDPGAVNNHLAPAVRTSGVGFLQYVLDRFTARHCRFLQRLRPKLSSRYLRVTTVLIRTVVDLVP